MVQTNHKSFLGKSPRTLQSEEIVNWGKKFNFPGPGSHSPTDKMVRPRVVGAFNLKGEREHSSYLGDSIYKGAVSPKYHDTKFDVIEPKVHTVRIVADKPGDKRPTFMTGPTATAKVSPVTYTPLDSFVKTQVRRNTIGFLKSKQDFGGTIHMALSTQKAKVAPNAYDPKQLEKGFRMTTLGASRGWK